MKNILEQGDIEEALSAASAVGDDAIQQKHKAPLCPMLLPMAARPSECIGLSAATKLEI